MFSKWPKIFVVMALIFAVGAHWTILQSVAWFGMAVSYSHEGSLKDALEKTFDGKHPCKICQIVAEGKKAEQKQGAQKLITKIELMLEAKVVAIYPPQFEPLNRLPETQLLSRSEAPSLPPPRLS